MSRSLPRCAKCGEPLVRRGRMLFEFNGNLGNPAIGWHTHPRPSCAEQDKELVARAVEDFKFGDRNGVPEPVVEVWGRDPLRVSLSREGERKAFAEMLSKQEAARREPGEQFESPCCGKPSRWEPGDFRRCPCGHRWRP